MKIKCQACDIILTDDEAVKKDKLSGEFLDLCTRCTYDVDDEEDLDDFYLDYVPDVNCWDDWE